MGINIKVSKIRTTTLVKCRSARVCPERLKIGCFRNTQISLSFFFFSSFREVKKPTPLVDQEVIHIMHKIFCNFDFTKFFWQNLMKWLRPLHSQQVTMPHSLQELVQLLMEADMLCVLVKFGFILINQLFLYVLHQCLPSLH